MCFLVEGARWEEEEEKGRRRERNGVRPPLRHCAHRCPLPPPFPPSCREQRRMARERKCTFTMAEWCKEARTVWIWEGFFLDCVQKRFGIRGETLKDLTRKTFRQQRTFQLLFDISCPKENCCRESKNREKPTGEKIILYFISHLLRESGGCLRSVLFPPFPPDGRGGYRSWRKGGERGKGDFALWIQLRWSGG